MALPEAFRNRLRLPAIAAPMFLTSGPDLVVEVCRSGLVGTFPALNQRTVEGYGEWLEEIERRLAAHPGAAPYGVNLIVHKSNPRLRADVEMTVKHRVPVVITSLGAVKDVVDAVHSYGGLVFHDVINRRHAEKAAEAGVDGIIGVAAGAGGHAGAISPFALIQEIREVFDGTVILSGAMSTGAQIAAARVMGADMGYLGTRFIATTESMVPDSYKQMVLAAGAADVVYTPNISGVHANFLRPSILAAGLDPDNLPPHEKLDMEKETKAWKNIWSAGQGVGAVRDLPGAADLCERLIAEYRAAMQAACADPFAG
ncbi:NAD(P)H-dependent flavin oxidoreductase [Ruixingdingia sedimenti]|uniref:Nitronate monooxygenase family protein n=1 Tax=Ruixingdingia sedimenti TaxID=3073604 RepID=A0ABU1FA48_9RHOB|nr:nitronate monooxygenase family protein [Xinfangfangia sp. LG-4]MDR5653729.1 nitronate monooxygenase family protein [Xinfangfangia sp. LG-4]